LTGITLLERLRANVPGDRPDNRPLNPLLRTFIDVCRAVEFAHARSVVHRDLKPSNIMLGDYGEVYILDWGVARVVGDQQPDVTTAQDLEALDDSTQSGALLGTPGYMAPEQIRNHASQPTVDIYALGSILFEILTHESLHGTGQAAIARTLSTPQDTPSRRRPEGVPPELDALCEAMLAEDPIARPTAHQVAERVQSYVDGDRDIERRKLLAAQQLAAARDSLNRSAPGARANAMRAAGRALALDPESAEAADLVGSLLLESPKSMPQELALTLEAQERMFNRDRSRKAIYAYLSIFLVTPVLAFLEIKSWGALLAFYGVVVVSITVTMQSARTGLPSVPAVLASNLMLAILFTRIAGPFILTPLLICCVLAAITSIPWINERTWVVVLWTLAATTLPLVFEWTGLLPRTLTSNELGLVIRSDMFAADVGMLGELTLVVASFVFTLVVGLFALGISRRRRLAQRQLYIHAWHLGQLIPGGSRVDLTTRERAPG
ncbi:MAG: serine/threonine-protein kinase, partial [Kofleriaceae bacterium]